MDYSNIKNRVDKIKLMIQSLVNEGKLEEALKYISRYEEIIKDDIEIYSTKGVIFMLENKYDEAEKILIEGFKINRNNFDILYNLGYLNEIKNNYIDCIKYYRLAEKLCENKIFKEEINHKIIIISKQYNINLENIEKQLERSIKKVLFVQSIPDIRTHKIAQILFNANIQVDIIYLHIHPKDVYKELILPYTNIYHLKEISSMIDFINNSDYDVLYSCNEPDYLTGLFSCTNKPLIFDCHDMMSLRGNITNEQIVHEYLANTLSNGNIYVTDFVKDIAVKKFNITNKPVMILDNYILSDMLPHKKYDKLSCFDGELHCVYEGGLTNNEGHHRNIENTFMTLAENKIHVHFYTPIEDNYYTTLDQKSKYLHWEGTKNPKELIYEMTKYDFGLTLLNVTSRNKSFLDSTFPNKVWDYLAAGIPILFSDLISLSVFNNIYKVGVIYDPSKDLLPQINRLKEIKICENYLEENNLLMDNYTDKLIEFMENIKLIHNNNGVILKDCNYYFNSSKNMNKKVSLVYRTYCGSNTVALSKLIPEEIKSNWDVKLLKENPYDDTYKIETLSSKLVVTTHGNYQFNNNQLNLELFHGFPLKSMALMDKNTNATGSTGGKKNIQSHWTNVDKIISYSQLYSTLMNSCIGIDGDKYVITGYPRNDFLYKSNGKDNLRKILSIDDIDSKRIIFSLPTFRQAYGTRKDGSKFWDNIFGIDNFKDEEFQNFLEKNNLVFILKLHPNEEQFVLDFIRNFNIKNIYLLENNQLEMNKVDLYEVLNSSDVLITDYSSIYFDYLLLGKPIVFTPTDIDEYRKTRGFLLEPYNYWTPGPKAIDQASIQEELLKSLNDINYYKKEREEIRNLVHFYQDGKSTERVWSLIENMIDNSK